jgi:hypothetical protein
LLQQSVLLAQVAPRLAHIGCAHVPPVHVPVQQSLVLWQALPADMHVGIAHIPAVQVALQQSLERAQAWPALRQTSCAQTPAEQDMLQQSPYALQVAPPCRHLPGGTGILLPASPPPLDPPELPLAPSIDPSLFCPPDPEPASVGNDWLPAFEAHPCPDDARTGMATRSATKAQARLMGRYWLMGGSLLNVDTAIVQHQATAAPSAPM